MSQIELIHASLVNPGLYCEW